MEQCIKCGAYLTPKEIETGEIRCIGCGHEPIKEGKDMEAEIKDLALRPLEDIKTDLAAIKKFQELVRSQMVKDVDYGVIPGCKKPSLLKPGAEKLAKLLLCSDSYEIISETEDWDKEFFSYKIRCSLKDLRSGGLVSEGIGECNSKESKYRYRWVFGSEVPIDIDKSGLKTKEIYSTKKKQKYTMYRLDNDDVCSVVNTIMKMAKKRALVDASLSAGRLSELFTQDIEDQHNGEVVEPESKDHNGEEKSSPAPSSKEGDWTDNLDWSCRGRGYITEKQLNKFIRILAKEAGEHIFMEALGDCGCSQPNEVEITAVNTLADILKAKIKQAKDN